MKICIALSLAAVIGTAIGAFGCAGFLIEQGREWQAVGPMVVGVGLLIMVWKGARTC